MDLQGTPGQRESLRNVNSWSGSSGSASIGWIRPDGFRDVDTERAAGLVEIGGGFGLVTTMESRPPTAGPGREDWGEAPMSRWCSAGVSLDESGMSNNKAGG